MFCVMNRVPVAPEWREAFEDRFRQRAGQVELQSGFRADGRAASCERRYPLYCGDPMARSKRIRGLDRLRGFQAGTCQSAAKRGL